jgi:N-acetylglucosaminyldiphosphoundecaprenol N-acetyl-beta-D-mannosaminyltransferase
MAAGILLRSMCAFPRPRSEVAPAPRCRSTFFIVSSSQAHVSHPKARRYPARFYPGHMNRTFAGPVRELFGIPITAARLDQVLRHIDETIRMRGRIRIGVVNAAKIVNMRRDVLLNADVQASHIIVADGEAVVWASRLLGKSLPERVAGIDLMYGMLERGSRERYRVYLLGATDEVLGKVRKEIAATYPGVIVVGSQNGYFTAEQEASVACDIQKSRADILLVAMTSPKKENFIARWSDELGVAVCHGVGGSFDVMAGKVQRAPLRWQRLGLEWLYRVKQEPRRLWRRYLVTNTLFMLMVVREMARQVFRRGRKRFAGAGVPVQG